MTWIYRNNKAVNIDRCGKITFDSTAKRIRFEPDGDEMPCKNTRIIEQIMQSIIAGAAAIDLDQLDEGKIIFRPATSVTSKQTGQCTCGKPAMTVEERDILIYNLRMLNYSDTVPEHICKDCASELTAKAANPKPGLKELVEEQLKTESDTPENAGKLICEKCGAVIEKQAQADVSKMFTGKILCAKCFKK